MISFTEYRTLSSASLRTVLLAGAGALALYAGTAHAQTGTETAVADEAEASRLSERMVVTAQKREENAQDVPIALTVLDNTLIESRFARNIESLQTSVPSLNFRKGNTTRNSALFLRGIGTISFSTAAEPSVSTVVDGVVMARSGMAFTDLFDIERIEVLRGPQGTLFGKNASVGLLNITTRRPGDTLGGTISLSAFEEGEYRATGAVDVPLADGLRSRITVSYSEFDGNITNVAEGTDPENDRINGYDHQGIRGILEWDAVPGLMFTLIGDYSEEDDDCCGEVLSAGPDGSPLGLLVDESLGSASPDGRDTRRVSHDLVTRTISENWGLSLQADWSVFSDLTLTSITAYRSWDNREIREGDFLSIGAAALLNEETGLQSPGTIQLHDDGPQSFEQFSQELRLASQSNQRLEWQVGLFYYNVTSDRQFTRDTEVCLQADGPAAVTIEGFALIPCTAQDPGFVAASATANFSTEFDNFAAFGQATYHITDRFRFTGGLRWTMDEVSFDHRRVNPTGIPAPGVRAEDFQASGETDTTNLSGRAALQYDLTDDVMAYGSYARGYKGPAFNTFFNMIEEDTLPISEETANSYEIGLKTLLLGGNLAFNVTGFYAEYNDFQANNFVIINGQVTTNLTNAGDISTKGVEVDFLGSLTDAWSISGGFAYTDAQVESSNAPPGTPSSFDDGARLAFAPEYALAVATDYIWEPDFAPLSVHFNTDYSWRSGQQSGLGPAGDPDIDAYGLWNASIGVSDREDLYRLTFIVKNITDEAYETINTPGGPAGTTRTQIPRDADRYVGVNFRARFGE